MISELAPIISTSQRFQNIQGLRAIAALMVFFYHSLAHYEATGGTNDWFRAISSHGFAGVDIFFVISGFVAAHSSLNKPRTLIEARAFGVRRFLRIYLGYWPFFGLMLFLSFYWSPQSVKNLDLLGSFFLTTIDLPKLVIFVTWSLSYELLFYLLVIVSFAFSTRFVRRLIPLLFIALLGCLLAWYGAILTPMQTFMSMLAEFLAGACVYLFWPRLKGWRWVVVALLTSTISFCAGISLNATNNSVRIFSFGTSALGLLVLMLALENSRWWVAGRIWRILGDCSYSLYLAHLSLLSAYYFTGIRGLLIQLPPFWIDFYLLCFLILSQALCCLYYRRVEAPIFRWACAFPIAKTTEKSPVSG